MIHEILIRVVLTYGVIGSSSLSKIGGQNHNYDGWPDSMLTVASLIIDIIVI